MEPILELDEPFVQVEPGAQRRVRLVVQGGGEEMERYRLEVLGDAARWAQVEPRQLAVPPNGGAQAVEVVFRPPHAATTPTLEVPFAVRAHSLEHRDSAAVVEGDVRVTAVPDLTATIDPATAAGRWGAGFRVHLEHTGAAALPLRLSPADTPTALRYAVAPRQLTLAPGDRAEVLVAVRSKTPKLVGAPVRHSVGVDYRADGGGAAGRLLATFDQRAVLPTPLFAVLAALLGAAVLAVVAGLVVGVPRPPATAPPATIAPTAAGAAAPTAATADPVNGYFVLYGPPTPVDDPAGVAAARALLARLQAAGVPARIVDSRRSAQIDDGPTGLVVVVRDGFPDRAAATAECAAHRDVAPRCVVVGPR